MKQVVVNADDFGICNETNLAIELAFQKGILTSASLMPNMPGFAHAIGTIIPRNPGLGVGVHLALTSGRCVADPQRIPLLVDAHGLFRRGFLGLLALANSPRSADVREQIECELSAQFERVRATGIALDHVNSHQHVHMIPTIWRIVVRLAARHGLPLVRLGRLSGELRPGSPHASRAIRGSIVKQFVLAACAIPTRRLAPEQPADGVVLRHPDRLVAEMSRAGMDQRTLSERLTRLPDGVTEIVTHPSLASMTTAAALAGSVSREDLMFLTSPGRRLEFEALINAEVKSLIPQRGIHLASFGGVARAMAAGAVQS
jgi:chitin disaccharide deacetylase